MFTYSERPYQPLVDANPESVILTVVHGQALYGTPELMDALVADQSLCEASACGEDRMFCVREVATEDGYDALETSLDRGSGCGNYAARTSICQRTIGTLDV